MTQAKLNEEAAKQYGGKTYDKLESSQQARVTALVGLGSKFDGENAQQWEDATAKRFPKTYEELTNAQQAQISADCWFI